VSADLVVGEEVAEAISRGHPVVALESTIISHGLPRPRNLEVARQLEATVRHAGAVPATIAVIGGRAVVGCGRADLEILAHADGVVKASERELPVVMAKGGHAATTVAATAFLAHRAGIRVFATGGLGGVHRGATTTFDESADLVALATRPITVVTAGVKSVLDVAATMERFETLGVTVVGYRTNRLPGFFVADGGLDLEWRVDDADQVVAVMAAADALELRSAVVVANPVPVEHQLDPARHDALLTEALTAAEYAGVHGKPVTPFLLDYIVRASGGASLEANVHAVTNNARVAGEIACAWSRR
jgi:pseudouridine-5'-phosphate glycosidase